MARRTDRKIPYGIADFKRIRNEGLYSVDKTEYLTCCSLVAIPMGFSLHMFMRVLYHISLASHLAAW